MLWFSDGSDSSEFRTHLHNSVNIQAIVLDARLVLSSEPQEIGKLGSRFKSQTTKGAKLSQAELVKVLVTGGLAKVFG